MHRHGSIAKQPLGAVHPFDAHLLLNKYRREPGAVDEQVRLQTLTAPGLHRGDITVLCHLDINHVIDVMGNALRGR